MSEDASSAESSGSPSEEIEKEEEMQEAAAPDESAEQQQEAVPIPDGFQLMEPKKGSLDLKTLRNSNAPLLLFKFPANFDLAALNGRSLRIQKVVDEVGSVGTLEAEQGRFSILATDFTRIANAVPSGSNGYRLGRPFAAGLTFALAPKLPPIPAPEAASNGGCARDMPRVHPPLKLRWRQPGATVAPNFVPLSETVLRKKEKRRSVHFEQTEQTPAKTPKRKEADGQASPADATSKKNKSNASPDATEAKAKKIKSASPTTKDSKSLPKATESPAPPAVDAVVSPPASKKHKHKTKE